MSKATLAKGIRWDLSDLYKSMNDPKIKRDKKEISRLTEQFTKKYKGKINSSKVTPLLVKEAIKNNEVINEKLYVYLNYASYLYSQDTADSKRQAFSAVSKEFATEITSKLKWFSIEIQDWPDKQAKKLINRSELKEYKHYLTQTRTFAPFKKSEEEEIIITKMNMTGASAFVKFYDEVNSSETFELKIDGKKQKLNGSQIGTIMNSHHDRRVREKAAKEYTNVYKEKKHFYTYVLNNLLLNKKTMDEIRGLDYPQQATFLNYEVSPETVKSLVSSVDKRVGVSKRFYKAKSKLLNQKLYEWDRYSSPYPKLKSKYTWNEAKEIVISAFNDFSPEFGTIAKEFFDKGWIDAEVRQGKRGGAFCSYCVPSKNPYLLVNFNGEANDVSTLAHELGHGIHAYVSRNHRMVNFYPSTAVAEIASVFCEAVVFEKLYSESDDKKVKINLLAGKIQGSLATIFRQTAFYQFEEKVHTHRREKGTLTTEDFNNYYQESLSPMFGKSLKLTDGHAYWWMPILHFYHYNFYVFTYAFGEALTNALFAKYNTEGDEFMESYTNALKVGGSQSPKEIVAMMGVDITDKNFWNKGIDLIEDEVNEFEKLIE